MVRASLVILIAVVAAGAGWVAGRLVPRAASPGGPGEGEAALAPIDFRNPLLGASPGEWAMYRLLDGKRMRLEVLKVDPSTRALTIREERRDPVADALLGSEVRQIGPNHFFLAFDGAGAVVTEVWTEDVEVHGKMIRCLGIETIGTLSGRVRHFYSSEIPALGLVKQVSMREGASPSTAELLEWSGRQ
jgi:hypothetical protein